MVTSNAITAIPERTSIAITANSLMLKPQIPVRKTRDTAERLKLAHSATLFKWRFRQRCSTPGWLKVDRFLGNKRKERAS